MTSPSDATEPAEPPDTTPLPGSSEATDPTTDDGVLAGDSADEGATPPPARRASRRPLVIGLAAVVAVLVVVLGVLLATREGEREPLTVVTETITEGPATPESEPIELEGSTELAAALPGTVLGYAVSAEESSTTMLDLHALEGWSLTYGSSAGDVQLQVGQWPTGGEALDALRALRDADGAETVGDNADVVVGGDTVGDVRTQLLSDGSEVTSWRNGDAVLLAQGPEGTTRAFYDAFPF